MAIEYVLEQSVAALKEYYEKKGQLRAYTSEFRKARNVTEEKLGAMPSRFIPKWCKALDDAGVPAIDARKIVEADARGLGWTQRAIIASLPQHYKNPKMVEYGSLGGKAVARKKGLAAASQKTRDRVAASGGEARAEDIEGLSAAGTKGGNIVKAKYGMSYFSEIGSKAHETTKIPKLEKLLTGEFEVNPVEWGQRVIAMFEEAKSLDRHVMFILNDSKLVTLKLAGILDQTKETA